MRDKPCGVKDDKPEARADETVEGNKGKIILLFHLEYGVIQTVFIFRSHITETLKLRIFLNLVS